MISDASKSIELNYDGLSAILWGNSWLKKPFYLLQMVNSIIIILTPHILVSYIIPLADISVTLCVYINFIEFFI